MNREINIEVLHVRKICSRCHVPYMVIYGSDHDQTCPYCSNEFYINDIVDLKKTNASLRKENKALKRSNASLKGVITKLRNSMEVTPRQDFVIKAVNKTGREVKQFELVSAELVYPDPYEVDLSDLENYDSFNDAGTSKCRICDYSGPNLCFHKGFLCKAKYGEGHYFKLKPNIKEDLESGKAVAKGGKL